MTLASAQRVATVPSVPAAWRSRLVNRWCGDRLHPQPLPRTRLGNPAALMDALHISFSTEQLDAITAPLEPGVIIAGAGSGKTTVMAARVVWLVGTVRCDPKRSSA